MKNLISMAIALIVAVICISTITVGNQVRQSATKSEMIIKNASEAFIDKVIDTGAINHKDYLGLMTQLNATGGTFSVTINVDRLYPVPVENEPGNFVMDYRPAYGFHSDQGGVTKDYRDPRWSVEQYGPAPVGIQYLVKSDNLSLVIKQVDAMDYQRTLLNRLSTNVVLGEWSYAKAVRNTGNSIVGNE